MLPTSLSANDAWNKETKIETELVAVMMDFKNKIVKDYLCIWLPTYGFNMMEEP